MHARFFDHAGSPKCLRWRSWTYCLPLHRQRRHPESVFYRGSMVGLHVPCRRFADILTDACARLGADVVRYSFIAVDLHHLLLAGLPAHLCKNSTRYNRTRNFGLYGHAKSKKTQKFVFRSALRPNQISFSHGQDPELILPGRQLLHCERLMRLCVGCLTQAVIELNRHAGHPSRAHCRERLSSPASLLSSPRPSPQYCSRHLATPYQSV